MKRKGSASPDPERKEDPRAAGDGSTVEDKATGPTSGEARGVSKLEFLNVFSEAKDHLIYAQVEFLTALKAILEGFEKGVEVRGEGTELKRLAESTLALRGLLDLAIRMVERFAPPRGRDSKMRALSAIRDVLERERSEANRAAPGPERAAAVDGLSAIIRVLDREIDKTARGRRPAASAKPTPEPMAEETPPAKGPSTNKTAKIRKIPIA